MGVVYSLFIKESKTIFYLGKNSSSESLFRQFEIEKTENICDKFIQSQESIYQIQINDEKQLSKVVDKLYGIESGTGFNNHFTNTIFKFCNNKTVYFINDDLDELYYYLKNELGYQERPTNPDYKGPLN